MRQAITQSIQYTLVQWGWDEGNDVCFSYALHSSVSIGSVREQRKQRHIKHGETNIPFYENDVANWRSEYFDSFSIYQHILSVFSLTPVLNVSHHLLFLRKH